MSRTFFSHMTRDIFPVYHTRLFSSSRQARGSHLAHLRLPVRGGAPVPTAPMHKVPALRPWHREGCPRVHGRPTSEGSRLHPPATPPTTLPPHPPSNPPRQGSGRDGGALLCRLPVDQGVCCRSHDLVRRGTSLTPILRICHTHSSHISPDICSPGGQVFTAPTILPMPQPVFSYISPDCFFRPHEQDCISTHFKTPTPPPPPCPPPPPPLLYPPYPLGLHQRTPGRRLPRTRSVDRGRAAHPR